ncbi:hypothetical protein [Methylotuvimicrobium alcaliphilum]|uniref:hypothetical protein n=1 Tax=Methylotuvimicrobium alcaliphilum TaxID=271065 RepID=UPI003B5CD8CA
MLQLSFPRCVGTPEYRFSGTTRYQPFRRSFAIWLSRLLRVKFKEKSIPEYQELTEENVMLAERLTDWTLQ